MSVSYDEIKDALRKASDPYTGIEFANCLDGVSVEKERVVIQLEFGYPAEGKREETIASVRAAVAAVCGGMEVEVELGMNVLPSVPGKVPRVEGVKNVIAVASGKGGVGKSTVAVNLALALSKEGASVGLLDGDIYGPSMGMMLGVPEAARPRVIDENSMEPITVHGMQCMSLAFVMSGNMPAVWRGPMASGAFQQLIEQTAWQAVDYLVVDLPPGTGDIQLTLAQKAPVSGAIIVTTPQDIALLDAVKGIEMFRTVEIPVIGLVENMSVHICTNCGHREHLFGEGGGADVTRTYETELLAELPLSGDIRALSDSGTPPVVSDPDGEVAQIFRETARRIAADLHKRVIEHKVVIPIVQIHDPS